MSKRSVVSLFTGAGGLDLGLEAAGFDCSAAVEMDDLAVATLQKNRDWNVFHNSIHEVSSDKLKDEASIREAEVDLLAGGPPCQPFSKSGYWHSGDAKRLDDPRASTLTEYLRVLRDLKPKAFLLENVPGLAFSKKDEGLLLLERSIEEINRDCGTKYSLNAAQLNAASYGIPQTRERVFIIGHREGRAFEFPEPTHALPAPADMANGGIRGEQVIPEGLKPPAHAYSAIGHLEDDDDPSLAMRGKWAALLPSIPEGQNYLFHTERGGGKALFGWRRRYWSFLLKLAKNRPSWTLTAQPGPAIGPFHWKSRRLSTQELCALQTFPSNYEVVGNISAAQKQLGNAVPSALAELLGQCIRRQLLDDDVLPQETLSLLPKSEGDPPPAEKPARVTQPEYLALEGQHSAHPGTGLGRGAVARVNPA